MKIFNLIVHVLACWLITSSVHAGPVWKVAKASMVIYGTSNLHGWEMEVKEVISRQSILFTDKTLRIENVELTILVNKIESGNSVMDSKAYDALKASTFPAIRFVAEDCLFPVSNNMFKGFIKGRLQIAGVTQNVEIPVNGLVGSDKTLTLKGEYIMDMTKYNVKPPTALLGTLKTGKEVRISFVFELLAS